MYFWEAWRTKLTGGMDATIYPSVKKQYTAYAVLQVQPFDVKVKGQAYLVLENMREALLKQVQKQHPGLEVKILILDENNKIINYKPKRD